MKRRVIITLSVFLLLGAVVNVAVAWGCVLLAPTDSSDWDISGYHPDDVRFDESDISRVWPAKFEGKCDSGWRATGLGVEVLHLAAGWGNKALVREYQAGWPSRSLRGLWWQDPSQGHEWQRSGVFVRDEYSLVRSSVFSSVERDYPLCPIWSGFAINTLFYATILWLLFAAPGSVRRWRRIRRGLCAKCSYPVGASDVCTECGDNVITNMKGRGSRGLPSPAPPVGGARTP